MKTILERLTALEEALEAYEAKTDATAWLMREASNTLARLRGVLEAVANSEGKQN